MNWQIIRERFPVVKEQTFFNHAAIAAPSANVVEAMCGFLEEHARRGSHGYRDWMNQVEAIRSSCASLIGAEPMDLAFVPNTSTGMSLVAEAFPWRKGDAVLVSTPDFPSVVFPWENLSERGVDVVWVPRREGRLDLEDIERVITPAARMLVVSSVDYVTGYAVDLPAFGSFCKEQGLVFGVDSIQSLGVLPLDIEKAGIDFMAAGAHKWLMGPMGIGLLFLSDGLRNKLTPPLVGWKSVVAAEEFNLNFDLRRDALGYEPGTLNVAGIFGLGAAIDLLSEVGIPSIQTRVALLLDELASGLSQRGLVLRSPWTGKHRAGILSFTGKMDLKKLFQHFSRRRVACALRNGSLRLSPHFYNNAEDISRFFSALDEFAG